MRVWLQQLESRGKSAARLCAFCGMLALVAFILLTNLDVLMRWLFNSPINGVADVGPLIVAIVVSSFFPLALAERYHVSIEFLGNLLGARGRAWLETLAALVSLVFFVLLAWQIVVYTIDLNAIGQTTWVVQIPAAPWWAVVSFFLVLCVAVQLNIFLVQLSRAKSERDADEHGLALPKDTPRTDGGS
jgi:TRAP-type C4-dicarboxylate transport system permease small subunit